MNILSKILKDEFNIENVKIENIVMDSRDIIKNSLFFAINNGNSYIDKALEMGASLVIADNYEKEDLRVIKVKNTIETMQKIANLYRKKLNLKVIGITGSNGKTTTKDILYSLLSTKYKCKKTLGNYNNHIGVPFTILGCQDEDEVLVLEMGMSSFGEIDKLCRISEPNYGIVTNIGDSHLEFLKTRANVAIAKLELAKYIDQNHLILFGDDFYLKDKSGIKVGTDKSNDFQIENIQIMENATKFDLNKESYEISLNGIHNVYNAAIGIAIAKLFGLKYEEIKVGLNNIKITSGRFEKIEVEDNIYINDAYNASPISTKYALETFGNLYNDRVKIVCLGDMLELGENEINFHAETIKKAKDINFDKIFLYGDRMKKALEGLGKFENVIHFQNKEEIKDKITEIKGKKAILLKGSRGMKMEEILDRETER